MANPTKAIVAAGAICGIMDITAALVVYGTMGAKPLRLLQGIAGGVLGPETYRGGLATALLGLMLHFVIAFGAATVFYIASRGIRFLVDSAPVRHTLRHRCLLLHAANRNPAFPRPSQSLFSEVHDHWHHHSHLLRWLADRVFHTKTLTMTGRVGGTGNGRLPATLTSVAALWPRGHQARQQKVKELFRIGSEASRCVWRSGRRPGHSSLIHGDVQRRYRT